MINQSALTSFENAQSAPAAPPTSRNGKRSPLASTFRFTNYAVEEEVAYRQAELFYLQKQIQTQTPMVIVVADGERVEGVIEWYDSRSLKVRGRERTLIYKSAIKYMYKLGEAAQ
jgi:sRNA-binding regulator protein Hfq